MSKGKMPISRARTAYGLLSEIRRLILEEPKRYNQNTWSTSILSDDPLMPSCGTVCCVAGWVKTLKRPESPEVGRGVAIIASDVLGLEQQDSRHLFHFAAAGERRDSDLRITPRSLRAHAKRGAAHIARFQKKYAKQLKAKRV